MIGGSVRPPARWVRVASRRIIVPQRNHRYLKKIHHTMDTQVMVTKATETTIKLNLRIRLSYDSAQLGCWSLLDVRFAVPIHPLAFTYRFF